MTAGADDPIIPAWIARALAGRIPDCRLELIDDGGHLHLFDGTPGVLDTVASFLCGSEPIDNNPQ